ncbi:hypothetical protein JCM31598_38300 [Desulfonatronum parangueonense]
MWQICPLGQQLGNSLPRSVKRSFRTPYFHETVAIIVGGLNQCWSGGFLSYEIDWRRQARSYVIYSF